MTAIYTGKVAHKGKYRGRHKAIVDPALWLKVHRVRRALTAVRRRDGRERDINYPVIVVRLQRDKSAGS